MAKTLGNVIKELAMNAMDSRGLCDVRYGVVISTMPLRIQLTPDYIIGVDIIMIPDRLTQRVVEMSDVSGDLEEVTWLVYEGLNVGDTVAMIRESAGGKYYILDRYTSAEGANSGMPPEDED